MWSRVARRASRLALLLAVLTAVPLAAGPLAAQDPTPPDTIPAPADTVAADTAVVPVPPEAVAQDTMTQVADTTAADTLRPAANLPVFPREAAGGFAEAKWEWDRAMLGRWHGSSLLELVEQVPGLVVTRAGWYGRPTGLASFGLGGGRVRVFLDGFELDPLASATFDLQHIAVVDLEAVRVERGLSETRIEVFTFRLPDRRPFSQIEAGTALFDTRILRGFFSSAIGESSVISVGLDLTDTDGWLRQHPFAQNTGLVRLSRSLGERTALQLEYRQARIDHTDRTGAPFNVAGDRRDLVLRARSLPLSGLALDATLGRSWRRPGERDTLNIELGSLQGAARARYDLAGGWVETSARLRNDDRTGFAAPTLELAAEAGLRPSAWFSASGGVRHARTGEVGGAELEGGLRLGPFAGFSLFAGAASGLRGIGIARDTVLEVELPETEEGEPGGVESIPSFTFPVLGSRLQAVRAGAEWSGWGARLGGAYVRHDVDSIAPFGLPFDRTTAPELSFPATGVEGYASIPLLYRPLRLEGSYTYWTDTGGRPYLPAQHGRIGLSFSEQFYGGNFEPTLRVEAVRRGSALVPDTDARAFNVFSTPYTTYNVYLQLRILDVRAFLIWENILNNVQAMDLSERSLGGQRALYGVRWHFFD